MILRDLLESGLIKGNHTVHLHLELVHSGYEFMSGKCLTQDIKDQMGKKIRYVEFQEDSWFIHLQDDPGKGGE